MSNLNVLMEKNRVHVVTDTAVYFRGLMFGYAQKAVPMPHLGGVLAVRGSVRATRILTQIAHDYTSARQLRELLPARLRSAYSWQKWRAPFDLAFAGIEDGRPFAWVVRSVRNGDDAAFVPFDVDGAVYSPDIGPEADHLAAGYSKDAPSLDAAVMRLAKAQRASGIIGGHLIVTTVSQSGIWQRKLHDFGDEFLKPLGRE